MTIALFVDGAFMYRSYPGYIDFWKLRSLLENELSDTVDEAYYFTAVEDPSRLPPSVSSLAKPPPYGPGFRLKIYWLSRKKLFWPQSLGGTPVIHPDGRTQFELVRQKGVDVGLAFHMVRSFYKRRWTKLVLCSGDGDFHEPVQSLIETEGVDLYLAGARGAISTELLPYAKKLFEVDQEPILSAIRQERPESLSEGSSPKIG